MPAAAEPGPGSISATFTAADTGEPSAYTWVFLTNPNGYSDYVATDVGGQVLFTGLTPDTYSLAVSPTEQLKGETFQVTLTETEPSVVVGFQRASWPVGDSTVTVVVTDSATGLAIEGASVWLYDWETGRPYPSQVSDTSGNAAFSEVSAGSFFLNVYASDYVYASRQFELGSASTRDFDIALVPANATITGTVTDEFGVPIPSLYIGAVLESDPSVTAGAGTDEAGNYTFNALGAGSYRIEVGGQGTSWARTEQTLEAIADGITVGNFTLAPRITGSISGYVLDGVEFGSWQDICVIAFDVTTGAAVGGSRTGEGGTYQIADLDAGEYSLAFWDCDYSRSPAFATSFSGGAPRLADAATYSVGAGEDVFANEHLVYPGGSISGHIELATADGSVPLPPNRGMVGTVYQRVGDDWEVFPNYSSFAGPGGQGDYLVSGLPAGEYRVGFADSRTGARAYAPLFWSEASTIEDATSITVSAGDAVTGIDGIVTIPEPTEAAVAVPVEALQPEDENGVAVTDALSQGETVDATADSDLAGEWVSVFGHSTPAAFGGWTQVASDGTIAIEVPKKFPVGQHTLVVQDAEGSVVGWVEVTVTKKAKGKKR